MSNPNDTKTLMSLVEAANMIGEAANDITEADKASRTGGKARFATDQWFTVFLLWNGVGNQQYRQDFKTLKDAEREMERLNRLYGDYGNPDFPKMKGVVYLQTHNPKHPWKNRTVEWFASRTVGEAANMIGEADKASRSGTKGKVGTSRKAMGRTYYIAFVLQSSGKWDIVKSFTAPNDDAANAYAERNYPNRDWYVLDANHNNINA